MGAKKGEVERLRDLIVHCWIHSGYQNCGREEMTTREGELFDSIVEEESPIKKERDAILMLTEILRQIVVQYDTIEDRRLTQEEVDRKLTVLGEISEMLSKEDKP